MDSTMTSAESTGSGADDVALTEDELCALALGSAVDAPPAADAVPMADFLHARRGGDGAGLLPTWYMPAPMARVSPRWRTPVVLTIVAAFVLIEAFGLCSTFGQIVPA
jgi:hypothetical protein